MDRDQDLARQITEERQAIQMRLRRMVHHTMNGFLDGQESSSGDPEDNVDQAQQELLKNAETTTYALLTARAKALDRAWESLRRGVYGICQTCGTPIPRRRLEAVPGAAFCLSCQEQMEQAG